VTVKEDHQLDSIFVLGLFVKVEVLFPVLLLLFALILVVQGVAAVVGVDVDVDVDVHATGTWE
jgi:hypothetical protein